MTDPFDILGVEPRFDLDLRALDQRHRDVSRALHPDRYAGAPAAERRLALGRAIEANEAVRILRDPIRRAEALMRRARLDLGGEAEQKAPPALLMEMLESREELSEAAKKKDLARVTRLGEAMRAREAAVLSALGETFASAQDGAQEAVGSDDPRPAVLKSLLPLVGELRYLKRFLDEVSAIEEDLTDPQ
jgi:molecular chaperone HscB